MFPLNSKTHSMNTRMEEKYEVKYEVKYANTERLGNSAIIYMQNLENEHERVCGLGLDLSSIVELGFGRTAKDLAMVLLLGYFRMVL